ncbi:MAG: transglycosylase domain-containing protein [Cytophagales bacterium]|nr:transglycosylase domain-containing protein [Cytophagales bacterium]
MPSLEKLENPTIENASLLFSEDGVLLGKYYRKNRTSAAFHELSKPLIESLLVTEDIRFFEHAGIDLKSLLRAVYGRLIGQYKGGGSTLTMQLAENLYRTSTHNQGSLYEDKEMGRFITKIKEWVIAINLERNFTKQEIMAMYLNTISFGSNAFGIRAAAKTFFNKKPIQLNYSESALLIGLINAPTRYSPILNRERSIAKRNEVLHNLYKYEKISHEEMIRRQLIPPQLQYKVESHNTGPATYFRSMVKNYMMAWASQHGYDLFGDGLRIYTTLDSKLQVHAEEALAKRMAALQERFDLHWENQNPWIDEEGEEIPNFLEKTITRTESYQEIWNSYLPPDSLDLSQEENKIRWEEQKKAYADSLLSITKPMKVFSWKRHEIDTLMSHYDSLSYYKRFLHAGLVSMDPGSGKIKAWVGGIQHRYFKFDHVLQGRRQPGSTFKPFVYTAVIDNGYTPCFEVVDNPITFYLPDQYPSTWSPSNAGGTPSGKTMTIRQAMARSVNSITAYWIKKMGVQTVVDYAHRLGITSPLSAVPALCLGAGGDVSIYEMTGAYSTFANKGIWTQPFFIQRIEDKNGNIIQEFVPKKVEAISEETAYLMLYMLRGATEEYRGTSVGLNPFLRHGNQIGAKTGTTQNASDGWFIGIVKNLVTGVWVGGEDRSIHFRDWHLGQGARTAMPIWEEYMTRVYKDPKLDIRKGVFPQPSKPLSISLDCDEHYTDSEDSSEMEIF